ncbi:MAG TPA: polyprenyl synthetase family protein [Actinomycetota bacterium]|nr:polyprenyl synthetase family protein [Actinomycetota bacterium]
MSSPAWLVDDLLRVEELLISTATDSIYPLVQEASTHLIKAGGKRLRPALVLVTSRAGRAGGQETDLAAAAVELLHIASLYHDDVIDETEVRRGAPSVHSKWGNEVAILAGDFLFASGSLLGAKAGGEVPRILARALADVCEGQIAENERIGDPQRTASQYVDTIKRKTAALFRASCELGAATSGADSSLHASLTVYGENLGLAFQMVDDLLDFVGDPRVTGKTPGTDLKEGVFTLPVLIASQRDPSVVGELEPGRRDLAVVLPMLRSTGALDATYEQAQHYVDHAVDALSQLPDSEWRDVLTTISEGVLAQVEPAA